MSLPTKAGIFKVYVTKDMSFPDTYYHPETPTDVIIALERAIADGLRVRIWYGDAKTGRSWGPGEVEAGTVGRSHVTPIVRRTSRSRGRVILEQHIVKIEHTRKRCGGALWIHKSFNTSPSPIKY